MVTIPAQKNELEVPLVSFVGKWIDATAEHDHRRPRGCDRRTFFGSDRIVEWVNKYHGGRSDFNEHGRHVLHELAEQWRDKKAVFDGKVYREDVSLTWRRFW